MDLKLRSIQDSESNMIGYIPKHLLVYVTLLAMLECEDLKIGSILQCNEKSFKSGFDNKVSKSKSSFLVHVITFCETTRICVTSIH